MTVRYPNIPSSLGCEVVGYLYDSDNPADLGQTMVEITTPQGVVISCGWLPEGDPNGSYCVEVSQGFRFLQDAFRTQQLEAAASEIEKLARVLAGEPRTQAAASTMTYVVTSLDWMDVEQAPILVGAIAA